MRVRLAQFLCGIFVLAAMATHVIAHEGHDHGNEPPPVSAALPRGSAVSADFELVAILRDNVLAIYGDRFATNEPVVGAKVDVETPEGPQQAREDEGVYRLEAPWAKPGAHLDLIVVVTTGDKLEILPVGIDVPEPETASSAPLDPANWLSN